MTINSARLVGLESGGAGMLTPQLSGDVSIIDPNMAWTIDVDDFRTTGRNCPFHGWNVKGRAIAAIVGGRLKMERLGARLRQAVPKEAIRAVGPVA